MKSQRQIVWGVGAALIFASVVVYLWTTGQGDNSAAIPAHDNPEMGSESTPGATSEAASKGDGTMRTDRAAPRNPSISGMSAMERLDRAATVEGLSEELLAQARAGDTEAMAAFAELWVRCAGLDPTSDEYPPRYAEKARAGSAERVAREEAARKLVVYCGEEYRAFADGHDAGIRAMLRQAAEQADLIARAKLSFHRESEAQIVEALSASDDPWIVERALSKLVRGDGPIARQVDREVFAGATLGRDDISRIKMAAARWRGCELGAACGPNQHRELQQCLYEGNCGLGMDVRTYIRQRELSGWQFQLMQEYLAALDAQLATESP